MNQKAQKKQLDILHERFGEKIVGGRLSDLATYSDLFEKLNESIFLIDIQNFQILECNPASLINLGETTETLVGKSFLEFIPHTSHFNLISQFKKARTQLNAFEPFDIHFIDSQSQLKTYELIVCRLKLADYCEVLQVIAKDVDQARAYEKHLQELSTIDGMTQIPNFRAFETELQIEHERALRYQTNYSLLFCDVDHFKNYNDHNGHPAGDFILKKIAQLLSENIRKSDFIARYGGEEFVILCKGSTSNKAFQLAEKLRIIIQDFPFPHALKQPLGFVSLSIGVSSYPEHGNDSKSIIHYADKAVYESKKSGRNKTTLNHK